MLVLLLVLLLSPGSESVPPSEVSSSEVTFSRCCPEEQVFSIRQDRCMPPGEFTFGRAASEAVSAPPSSVYGIEPPFASVYQSLMYEDYEYEGSYDYGDDAGVSTGASYSFHPFPSFPSCDPQTEDLLVRLVPSNEISITTFLIDDANLTSSQEPFSLIDLNSFDQHTKFCIDQSEQGTIAAFCATKLSIVCKIRPCVSQCCQQGHVVSARTGACDLPADQELTGGSLDFGPDVKPEAVKYFFNSEPQCMVHTYDEFKMQPNGNVEVGPRMHNHTEYCVERFEQWDNDTQRHIYEFKALVCAPTDPYSHGYLRWVRIVDLTIVPILFLVSIVFLGLLFIYVFAKNRHKLFGAMTLHLIAMLFLFYVCLIFSKIKGTALMTEQPTGCVALGLCIQYFYLSAIFWLNAMSFDIWSTFRRMRSQVDIHPPANGWLHKRFKWYALYSQGGPLLIVLVTLGMQLLPADTPGVTLPGIGVTRCFLDTDLAMIFYLNLVIVSLLGANVALFLSSTWNLCCGVWADRSGDPGMRDQQKTRYITVIKMFFAMGITWVSEAVAHLLDLVYGPEKVKWLVLVFKILNSLQGFILFCCIFFDSARIASLKKALCGIEPKQRRVSHMTGSTSAAGATGEEHSRSRRMLSASRRTVSKMLLPARRKSEVSKNNPEEIVELKTSSPKKEKNELT